MRTKKAGRLAQADDFLMIPEYLLWKLCGVKAREYTNATSTGLVNAQIREYDPEILSALGLPETMFPPLTAPGTVLGPLKPEIASEVGGQTNVVLCATHDTASAVEGIPMEAGGGTVPFFRHLEPVGCQTGTAGHHSRKLQSKFHK